MSRLLLASLLVLGLASASHAQVAYAPYGYGYGYAVPVVPITPEPYTAFYGPQGSFAFGPGYTSYYNAQTGTGFQIYNPNVQRGNYGV